MVDDTRNCVPHIGVAVDENDVERGAMRILEKIRPQWEKDSVEFKLLTDGITNKLVGCRPSEAEESETVLVRIYGNKTDLLIDRKAETRNIILLNNVNLAPNLYATFDNGLAYRFVPGNILNKDTVRDPHIYKLVAKRMAKLHKVKVKGEEHPKPFLWEKLSSFLQLVPDVFTDSKINERYQECVMPKAQIREELQQLESSLKNCDNPIVFAHNDLLLGNVIYTQSEDSVTFIDFEYAAFNYQPYDIGNHFAEFVGIGTDLDYSLYPDKQLQMDWIRTYLAEYHEREPTEEEVEELYVRVNEFVLVSHLFWGIWGLIQAEHSYIDFDYMGYANVRFKEYFAKKSVCPLFNGSS